MSQHLFGLYRGHLTAKLIRQIEREFRGVDAVNYTEPNGEKRGWFAGPNRGYPFDDALAAEVRAIAGKVPRGADSARLGLDDDEVSP